MREYETTFIVQPEISDEGSAALLTKLDGILEAKTARRLMCDDLGKRKLAYEIKHFQKGHYYVLSYLDRGEVVPEIERTLRIEESVLRFMTVQLADEVTDIETRVEKARELEIERKRKAEERAAREAEEARARLEVSAMPTDVAPAAPPAAEQPETESTAEASSGEGDTQDGEPASEAVSDPDSADEDSSDEEKSG